MTQNEQAILFQVSAAIDTLTVPVLAAVAKHALMRLESLRELDESEIPLSSLDQLTDRDPDL